MRGHGKGRRSRGGKVREGDWLNRWPHGYAETPLPGLPSEEGNRIGKPRRGFKFKIKLSFIHFSYILRELTHSHLGDIGPDPVTLG